MFFCCCRFFLGGGGGGWRGGEVFTESFQWFLNLPGVFICWSLLYCTVFHSQADSLHSNVILQGSIYPPSSPCASARTAKSGKY